MIYTRGLTYSQLIWLRYVISNLNTGNVKMSDEGAHNLVRDTLHQFSTIRPKDFKQTSTEDC